MRTRATHDLVEIAKCVCDLIKAHELNKAEDLLESSYDEMLTRDFKSRAARISAINASICEHLKAKALIDKTLDQISDENRKAVEAQLCNVMQNVFDRPIAELRKRKRRLSRPGKVNEGT